MNQKGIAYLLVLILGGIIVTSSIVYYSSTVIESRVSSNSRMAKEVFYHTESSINNATSKILKKELFVDPDNPSSFNQTLNETKENYQLNSNVIFNYLNTETIEGQEVINQTALPFRTVLTYEDIKIVSYNVTAQGNLVKNGKNLLPRKVGGLFRLYFSRLRHEDPGYNGTTQNYVVTNSTTSNWPGFKYGINSGGTLEFSGSTVVRNGGVYSKTNVNLGNSKNQLRIDKGEAYSSGTITGKGIINNRAGYLPQYPNQPILTYPTINMSYYASIADRSYGLGVLNYMLTLNSFTDLNPLPIDSSIKEPSDVAVVYVNGNLKITGRFVNTQPILLVVKGTVSMTGNADMGSPTIPFGIIAGGDINRSTGNAEVNGFYYTPGKIDMKGNFTLKGALVAANGVNLTGNVDIYYSQSLAEKLPLILDPDDPNYSSSTTKITVTASPGTINPGGFSTLTWTTENVTELTVTPSIGLSPMPVNNQTGTIVSPQTTTTYTFTATGTGGTVTVRVTIIVTLSPTSSHPPDTTRDAWTIVPDTHISRFEKGFWWQKID